MMSFTRNVHAQIFNTVLMCNFNVHSVNREPTSFRSPVVDEESFKLAVVGFSV